MAAESAAQRNLKESQILARKIDLLLDVVVTTEGKPYEFQDIQSALAEKGVKLSRTRWHHMKTGDATVRQPPEVVIALAEFFQVNPDYLLNSDGEVPERIQHELELLASMRRAKVKEFATRTLADVDNETLDAIAALLDDSQKY
ncbi:helix-turn-helix domain-containing protein [Arthrobacter sp. zg-Y820]|uniref:helix-turn-helix domain-containing protein n=1 Tax=unclassified Arthrobacter TaxID=235627 RepID=UPI001E30CFF2|nr:MULTISPECIES: helix-turn-helix domain-containing protein [unclassified Arthrobacter]MCC9195654.1 helix-turn-helix domain-containing protein [Arthrobacter sp. zg-Y820]MDK1278513.1 helix-turn-helix domain-containing protein [Arthrobacter sp. zg.Y820]MDK1359882.1 helix-turn-helix domain-containing protein [Arthrobacter sp. zg-Y1219]WIB09051.1 helix-turn-helix domain-containing protein [Arthrobacter sp. zg-Y820]